MLALVLLLMLGFGYHLVHNLKRAGVAGHSPVETGRVSNDAAGSQKPQP